jgi:hypothetical protein
MNNISVYYYCQRRAFTVMVLNVFLNKSMEFVERSTFFRMLREELYKRDYRKPVLYKGALRSSNGKLTITPCAWAFTAVVYCILMNTVTHLLQIR